MIHSFLASHSLYRLYTKLGSASATPFSRPYVELVSTSAGR